jgi:ubiquitin-conjugating enzyme E2 variant
VSTAADAVTVSDRRPRAQQALEATALAFATVGLTVLVAKIAPRVNSLHAVAGLAVALLTGYLAADLVSGLIHWFCDRFFEEDTPLIGRLVIAPFREHHRDPRAMTRHGALELLGNSALGTLPFLGLAWWCGNSLFVESLTIAFAVAAIAANQFHAWAHARDVPRPVRWLHAHWLVLPPAHHARHHHGGYDRAFCMTTGWMNRCTDGLGLFAALERALVALGVPRTSAP